MTSDVKHVQLSSHDPAKNYSQATVANGFAFLSGLTAHGEANVSTMSLRDQLNIVFARLSAVLAAMDLTTESIVKVTCYLVDADDFAEFNTAYGELMKAPYPARTTVVTQLASPALRVELEVLAVVETERLALS